MEQTTRRDVIRTLYLYLFSLVGLSLLIVGFVRLVDLGLKVLIFKNADQQYPEVAPFPPESLLVKERGIEIDAKTENITVKKGSSAITEEDRVLLSRWEDDYIACQKKMKDYDPVRRSRESEGAGALAFIIIGMPVYLYHWRIIKKGNATLPS